MRRGKPAEFRILLQLIQWMDNAGLTTWWSPLKTSATKAYNPHSRRTFVRRFRCDREHWHEQTPVPLWCPSSLAAATWVPCRGSLPAWGMISVHIDPPACLDGRIYSLFSEPFAIHVFYPEFLQCSIFFGRLRGWLAGLSNHVSNLLEATCQVSELTAAAFRGEDQLSRPVDLIFVREGHLLPHGLCDPVGARQMESDFGLGVHFVNVLTPRTTAPTVRYRQAIYRNVIVALLCVVLFVRSPAAAAPPWLGSHPGAGTWRPPCSLPIHFKEKDTNTRYISNLTQVSRTHFFFRSVN